MNTFLVKCYVALLIFIFYIVEVAPIIFINIGQFQEFNAKIISILNIFLI